MSRNALILSRIHTLNIILRFFINECLQSNQNFEETTTLCVDPVYPKGFKLIHDCLLVQINFRDLINVKATMYNSIEWVEGLFLNLHHIGLAALKGESAELIL